MYIEGLKFLEKVMREDIEVTRGESNVGTHKAERSQRSAGSSPSARGAKAIFLA
jgi:hypothetical protein